MWEILWFLFLHVAVPAGLAYLGGRLLAPEPESEISGKEGSQSRSWNPHTTSREGIPRPRAYGKNMHHGNIVAKWTDVSGTDREILYMIVEYGDGPTKGIGAGLVYLNDQPVGNYGGVTVIERLGTMDQTCMAGFEKTKLEYVINNEMMYDVPITFTTPNDFFDDIEFTFLFPNGLLHYHKDGSMHTEPCRIQVHIRERPAGGWVTIFDDHIVGVLHGGTDPIFKLKVVSTLGYNVEYGKQYDIKFTKKTAVKENHINNVFIKSIREVVDTPFTRPGKALIGIKAVATNQLSGSIDVKVIREDRLINVFNGSTWSIEYSRNRAWVVWDILTQPIISGSDPYTIERYEGVDPTLLDLSFFYTWAQFCSTQVLDGDGGTEDRIACDLIVDFQTDIFSLAHEIAQVGRAYLYWQGHTLTGWIDTTVTTPIDLVTMNTMMANTWKNVWATKKELAGGIEVFYQDSRLGYERTPAIFTNENAGLHTSIVGIEGIGITTRGTAIHCANHALERNRLIRNINTFRMHKDAFRYKLGQVVRIQCKVANWGHGYRVVDSTATNKVTLDRNVVNEISIGDLLYLRAYDSVAKVVRIDVYTVESAAANVVTIEETWIITPAKGNNIAVGVAGAIKLRRIIKMQPTADNFFDATVETYNPTLFAADELDPDNPDKNYIWPEPARPITGPITRAEVTDLIAQLLPPQPNIEIPWPANLTWTGDDVDTVTWSRTDADEPISFRYEGTTYEITPDNTTDKFIYWDPEYNTVFRTTNLASVALDTDHWLMCVNKDGVAFPANAVQLMHAGVLMAGTITADKYLELRNTYVYTSDDSLDSGSPFELPFKIVSELRTIISIKLSFRLMPFRAYSTAALSSGQISTNTIGETINQGGATQTGYGGTGGTGYAGPTATGYADGGSHFHTITAGSHSHSGPNHTHTMATHTHSVTGHLHTISGHTHNVEYGIHEENNSPTIHYHINNGAGFGAPSANYTTSQLDLNITGSLSGTGWKAIRFDTNVRCRIAAIVECKLDIDA